MVRKASVVLVLLVLFWPGFGLAQDPHPVPPADVEALRAKIAELEQELLRAKSRIADLERQLIDAGQAPDGSAAGAEGASPEAADRSPDHLLGQLKTEFREAFPDPAPTDERGRRQYLRVVAQWANKINREYRQRIDWVCEIVSRDLVGADEAFVDLQVIDSKTGEPVGSRFLIEWPRRLRSTLGRFEDGSRVRVRGLLIPEVRTNESRAEPGAFDIPPLIGPYVEFRFTVQLTAAGVVEDDPHPDEPTPQRQPEG